MMNKILENFVKRSLAAVNRNKDKFTNIYPTPMILQKDDKDGLLYRSYLHFNPEINLYELRVYVWKAAYEVDTFTPMKNFGFFVDKKFRLTNLKK